MKTINSEIDTLLDHLNQSDGILSNLDFQTEAHDADHPLLIWAIASRASVGIALLSITLGLAVGYLIWGLAA